ncbi:MAG TPA: hypothetical protein VIK77_08140 [Tissierellaceae bacterium]
MTEVKKPMGIVAKILSLLNITEEGRIDKFFGKQRSLLTKDIKNLNKNLDTLKNQEVDDLEELNEQLEDAEVRVEEAYTSVAIKDIATNEAASKFAIVYWENIEKAESEVSRIKEQIEKTKERYAERRKDIQEQIAERERRLSKIQ